MRRYLVNFVKTYLLFVIVFVLQKPVFLLFNHNLYPDISFTDYLNVIWNGLPLDLSIAGYLTIVPGFILILAIWLIPPFIKVLREIYFSILSFLLSVIFISDIALYGYWGFRLDSTPLFYVVSSPKDAFASVGTWTIIIGIIAVIVYAAFLYLTFKFFLIYEREKRRRPVRHRWVASFTLLLLTALLIIPIRGGFSVSTMNISKVYYSENIRLNHAAINPAFSLLESLVRERNFSKQHRYMSREKADNLFSQLVDVPVSETDTVPQLIHVERPNIIFVVLEGFSSRFMQSLGGEPDIAANLDSLAKEGVLFTNFYANSFRTDRGLVSLFSGYPAQPTTSIMKYPRKTQSLPSIPASLKKNGYNLSYYYGGDVDFTNMRSYLISMGITRIVSDTNFPLTERLSKWGAHDHVVFDKLIDDLNKPQQQPFMKIIQTSSSHEPYEVPYEKLNNPLLNSVAYTDSCLGDFIGRYKQMEYWENSLIVVVPDHGVRYPDNLDNSAPEKHHIPFILAGGAVSDTTRIDTYGSQIDIAATLLYQLKIPHDDFVFSKNMLNPSSPHFAFYTFPNAFGLITSDTRVVFNADSQRADELTGENAVEEVEKGKAYLQKLYDDLDAR